MGIKGVLVLVLLLFSFSLFAPRHASAATISEVLTSENSIITKISEGLEYFFAFRVENKVAVLEKHAEKRLDLAEKYSSDGDEERVQNLLQNYQEIKERQNELLGKTNNGDVLGAVQERTIEQQKTLEQIKTRVSGEEGKQEVVQVQEQVVNQVAQRVVEVNGAEGQTEFFDKVEHVWAPGTGPGGEAGVIIEGGMMQFAPGTGPGGPSSPDIKNVEVKTGGGDSGGNTVIEGGNQQLNESPDTTSGSEGAQNVIDE